MKIAVSVESTNDLSKELLSTYDIKVVPYQITLGDMIFKDGEKTTEEILKELGAHKIKLKDNKYRNMTIQEIFDKDTKWIEKMAYRCKPEHTENYDFRKIKTFYDLNNEDWTQDFELHIEDQDMYFLYIREVVCLKKYKHNLPNDFQWKSLKKKYNNEELEKLIALGNADGWQRFYTIYTE